MNLRVTVVALLVALGLGGYLYWNESDSAKKRSDATEKARLVPIQPGDVTQILIRHTGQNHFLVRGEGGWALLQPVEAHCDGDAVQAFLDTLAAARREGSIGRGQLQRYGLDAPAATVVITSAAGDRHTLRLGQINPTQTLVYTLIDESDEVVLTTSALLSLSLANALGWRNKHMASVAPEDVHRLFFSTMVAGSLQVRRDAAAGWVTDGEVPWRVDPRRMQGLLAELAHLQAVGIGAENKAELRQYGVHSDRFRAILMRQDSSIAADVTFGFATGEGGAYAIVPDKPEIFLVDGKILDAITDLARQPRDRKLFRPFQPEAVHRLEVESPTDSFALVRQSVERWSVERSRRYGTEMHIDPSAVQEMLESLLVLEIADYPAVQPNRGLYDPPRLSVRLFDRDGKRLAGVDVGFKDPNGLFMFARALEEPAVFLVSPTDLIKVPFDLERLGSEAVEVPPEGSRG